MTPPPPPSVPRALWSALRFSFVTGPYDVRGLYSRQSPMSCDQSDLGEGNLISFIYSRNRRGPNTIPWGTTESQ